VTFLMSRMKSFGLSFILNLSLIGKERTSLLNGRLT
jgi:hypothetical protein